MSMMLQETPADGTFATHLQLSGFGISRRATLSNSTCLLAAEKGAKNSDPRDSRIANRVIHKRPVLRRPAMLTTMTDADWITVLNVFAASRSRRGDKGRDDKRFLSALHYFVVHNITWRALPAEFGNWNSIWKRFWRLSQSGVFEAFFEALAAMSDTAHMVQMFDSIVVRAHVSAAGAKGGRAAKLSAVDAVDFRPRFT
jgi:transposase